MCSCRRPGPIWPTPSSPTRGRVGPPAACSCATCGPAPPSRWRAGRARAGRPTANGSPTSAAPRRAPAWSSRRAGARRRRLIAPVATHQPSTALVRPEHRVVARRARDRLRVGDAGPRDRARQRRSDGDHAVSLQADRRRRADALQRQQAAPHLRRRPRQPHRCGSSPTAPSTSTRSTGRRRATRSLFVSNREADPDKIFNYDLFAVNVDGRRGPAPHRHQERGIPPGLVARRHAHRVCRHDARPHSSETTMEDTHVWVMRADGTGRVELGEASTTARARREWSPDGRSVYFTVQERGARRS